MTGITLKCAHCGRPIVGVAVYGNLAEPYHPECTRPPAAQPTCQVGCICPPGSEATCKAMFCHRRGN